MISKVLILININNNEHVNYSLITFNGNFVSKTQTVLKINYLEMKNKNKQKILSNELM